jgi:fumarylacetoacetate (FAA) hydrolase
MSAHGPDRASYDKAVAAKLEPHYLADTLAFMFESRYVFEPTARRARRATLDPDYDAAWSGFRKPLPEPDEARIPEGPTRDGTLLVVESRPHARREGRGIAPTMQYALENWEAVEPQLRDSRQSLEAAASATRSTSAGARAPARSTRRCRAPTNGSTARPTSRTWSACGARATTRCPESFYKDPLMYQGGAGKMMGPARSDPRALGGLGGRSRRRGGRDRGRRADGATPAQAASAVRLVTLVNDVSFRRLIPAELAKGFGFVNGKGANALSPVAVTPDELGGQWQEGRVHHRLTCHVNAHRLGHPQAGIDATFGLFDLVATPRGRATSRRHAHRHRHHLQPRRDGRVCVPDEARLVEQVEQGEAKTPFLRFGDTVKIEMLDAQGQSIFGAIEQKVEPVSSPRGRRGKMTAKPATSCAGTTRACAPTTPWTRSGKATRRRSTSCGGASTGGRRAGRERRVR